MRRRMLAVVLSVSAFGIGVALADAPGRHYQVAVFTNGLTATHRSLIFIGVL